jgi:hypothetical protein
VKNFRHWILIYNCPTVKISKWMAIKMPKTIGNECQEIKNSLNLLIILAADLE